MSETELCSLCSCSDFEEDVSLNRKKMNQHDELIVDILQTLLNAPPKQCQRDAECNRVDRHPGMCRFSKSVRTERTKILFEKHGKCTKLNSNGETCERYHTHPGICRFKSLSGEKSVAHSHTEIAISKPDAQRRKIVQAVAIAM